MDRAKVKSLTKEQIESEYQEYVLDRFINENTNESSAEKVTNEEKTLAVKVGENLRVIREYRNMSREELADKTNLLS